MNMPVLSVIIPMYNTSQFIRQCLDSIVVQDEFPNFQVIVVDDGSTDNSATIVSEYLLKFPNIELYRQPNSGVSVARNRGIDVARGQYISFVDADDMIGIKRKKYEPYYSKELVDSKHDNLIYKAGYIAHEIPSPYLGDKQFFSRLVKAARKNNSEIAFGGKIGIQDQTRQITALLYNRNRVFGTKLSDKQVAILQSYDRESANFAIYQRDFLDRYNLRFEVDMPLDEDILFCSLAVLYAKKISTVRDSVYYYNRHSGTLTDYAAYMPSHKARARYSTALIQYYGVFLLELAKHPEYATIYKKYMREFASMSYGGIRKHTKYFPGEYCHFCRATTCEDCDGNTKNIARIKRGLQKLMPNKNQKIK